MNCTSGTTWSNISLFIDLWKYCDYSINADQFEIKLYDSLGNLVKNITTSVVYPVTAIRSLTITSDLSTYVPNIQSTLSLNISGV